MGRCSTQSQRTPVHYDAGETRAVGQRLGAARSEVGTVSDMWPPEICGGQRVTCIGINQAVILGATYRVAQWFRNRSRATANGPLRCPSTTAGYWNNVSNMVGSPLKPREVHLVLTICLCDVRRGARDHSKRVTRWPPHISGGHTHKMCLSTFCALVARARVWAVSRTCCGTMRYRRGREVLRRRLGGAGFQPP
jgi:hypothetical protein